MNPCNCGFLGQRADSYIAHCNFHHQSQPNFQYNCPVIGCSLESYAFANLKYFRTHVIKFNTNARNQGETAQLQPVENGLYKCTLQVCQHQCADLHELKKHLVVHIEDGLQIKCPFLNCTSSFNSVNSSRSHNSRYHKSDLHIATEYVNGPGTDHVNNEFEVIDVQTAEDDTQDYEEQFEDQFLKKAALLYMQLQAKYHLPNKTIQFLIENVCELHGFADQQRIHYMKDQLLEGGYENVDEIVDALNKNNI